MQPSPKADAPFPPARSPTLPGARVCTGAPCELPCRMCHINGPMQCVTSGSGVLPGIKFLRVIHGVACAAVSSFLLNNLCFSLVLVCFLPELRVHRQFSTGMCGGTVLSRVDAGCSQPLVERLAMLIDKPNSKRDLCQHANGAEAETP